MKIALVGATGLVGGVMMKVLEEENFSFSSFYPVASERSVGKKMNFQSKEYTVIGLQAAVDLKPDIAIFSAGGTTSLEWAPRFAEVGTVVIDNSSAWRMDPTKKLIVPEINASSLTRKDKIIANPNCSTIQLVLALNPLYIHYEMDRLIISTYQSITGTGKQALDQFNEESRGEKATNPAYPYPIFNNCIPHCDVFLENDYTKEEMKLVHETRKILGDDSLRITSTAVRVPVQGGHSEAVNIEFKEAIDIENVKNLISNQKGIELIDDVKNNKYPMPLFAKGKNPVFVGRIRRDESVENGLNMWVVADNLRKGAATNAVQIAQYLVDNELVGNP